MAASYIGSFLMGQQLTALQVALDAEKARTEILETWASDRVKYAYPNGGSEGDEKTLSINSVYFMNSPFPIGVKFFSVSEYYDPNSETWIEYQSSAITESGNSYGAKAWQKSQTGQVVMTTAKTFLGHGDVGLMLGYQGYNSSDLVGFKWRVRCVRED